MAHNLLPNITSFRHVKVRLRARIFVNCYIHNHKISMDAKKCTDNVAEPVAIEPDVIKEGKAEILVNKKKNVFYNPVQEFNRDLSIAVLSLFATEKYENNLTKKLDCSDVSPTASSDNGIFVLEALSATGLRSIRYAKEVPHIRQIIANDISDVAVETIKRNVVHNKVENLIQTSHEDAIMVMYQHRRKRFDAVDLDPYGCPSIFLDAAVQSVAEGGLLLVTATDMAVLAGNSPETCYVKYGAVSLKSKSCHEMALRILLQHIASHAGRYGRYIEPLLSLSVDFYIRVFVRIYTGQSKCKNTSSNIGTVYQCVGCESFTIQPLGITKPGNKYCLPSGPPVDKLCKHCHHKHQIGGPMWLGLLHNQPFVSSLLCQIATMELGTMKRLLGVLNVVYEEVNQPLYYTLDRLMSIVHCETPPMVMFRSALLNAGYKVSISHANKTSIKTDAPNDVIWDIVRAWEKLHPARREKFQANSPALAILTAKSTTEISLERHPHANPASRQNGLSRFQENPTAYWGPGTKSTNMVEANKELSKKKKNQNKNSKKKYLESTTDQDKLIKSENTIEECDTIANNDLIEPPIKKIKNE